MSASRPSKRAIAAAVLGLAVAPIGASCGDDETIGEAGASKVDVRTEEGFYVPLDSRRVSREPPVVETRRDNPILGGQVRLTDPRFARETTGPYPRATTVCCENLSLLASGATFAVSAVAGPGVAGAAASVRADEALDGAERITIPGADLYQFRSPALLMRPDHTPATVRFERDSRPFRPSLGREPETIALRLAPDVIVLPVYLHEFVAPGAPRRPAVAERVRASFDPLGIVTRRSRDRRPDGSVETTTETRRWTPFGIPPDRIWAAAGIQFRLLSGELIEQSLGLESQITGRPLTGDVCADASKVADEHRAWREIGGIHVYVGGTIQSSRGGTVRDVSGATCGAWSSCRSRVSRDDFIVLDSRRASGDSGRTIARELGHYLGLADVTEARACGGGLLDSPDEDPGNLMRPFPEEGQLSPRQVTRARALACGAFGIWGGVTGFRSPSC